MDHSIGDSSDGNARMVVGKCVGAEFVFVGGGEGGEFLVVFGGEQDGLLCIVAELGGVGCGVGLAFGRAGACGELGVSLIGFDLRGRGHFVSGSF